MNIAALERVFCQEGNVLDEKKQAIIELLNNITDEEALELLYEIVVRLQD